jgi:hypothetical protein
MACGAGGDYYLVVCQESGHDTASGSDGTGSYTLEAISLDGDILAPSIHTIMPANGATGISLFGGITLTFDEPVALTGGEAKLRNALGELVDTFTLYSGTPNFNGVSLTLHPRTPFKPGASYVVDLSDSGITDLAGNKLPGSNQYSFTTVNTVDADSGGNDLLAGRGIGASLNGGAGTDMAVYAGYHDSYAVTRSATETTVQRTNWSNTGKADVLSGVERLLFDDGAVALDTDGAGGQAYRLYLAAFNRMPDKAGVGYWIAQLDKGASLHDVAQSFIDSAEFIAQYGASPTNAAFVDSLYQNVLHRAGEQAGVDYWNGVLAKGASRADVLAAFSEGAENQAAVLKVIGNGFDYTPYG